MPKPAILVISSHVVRGTVGTRAAAFALEVLGHPVWTVPTVTLPWHPGHTGLAGAGQRIMASDAEFAAMMQQLADSPWIGEIEGILSGYFGNVAQVEAVAKFVTRAKANNPKLRYLLDPVIGDHGNLYVVPEQAQAVKEQLLPLADMTSPNPFEMQWLTGSSKVETALEMLDQAKRLGPANVAVTSAPGMKKNTIGILMLSEGEAGLGEHRLFDKVPNGLGDLTSALLLSHSLTGLDPMQTLRQTTASVFEVMRDAALREAEELSLESAWGSLLHPKARIDMTSLSRRLRRSSLRQQVV